ncbi:hypothetical protein H9X95_15045 [Micromonospora chalcea]|uniref:hypothetical protein n=1 Tax=Micromonospora chalcea TaxID=1874 RepID=UPI001656E9BE|nr:hypothetical protein [Micromonospora chalcea]MBC8991469.1 hypothetical protein [Micromonospora chalcea]
MGSDLKESITSDSIFSEIMMLRTSDARTIVLVEGPEDVAALEPHMLSDHAFTLPTTGKGILLGAVELIDQAKVERVLAIADLDWTNILYPPHVSNNLIYTEHADMDITILKCPMVITRICWSHCDAGRLKSLLQRSGHSSVLDLAVVFASAVGALRLASVRDGLQLNLRKFPVHDVIDLTTLAPNLRRLAELAVQRSKNVAVSVADLEATVKGEIEAMSVPLRYCSGHDLIAVIAAILKGYGSNAGADALSKSIHSAFSCGDLRTTSLYLRVSGWAELRNLQIWSC